MADVTIELLKTHFRQLRLPTMGQEFEKLARDAVAANQTFVQFLLRLTELELATRAANAVATRIKQAEFPVLKDLDTYDFSVMPGLSKPKVLELSRCEWIEQESNCCLVGNQGTGKTHLSVALGQAACRAGLRVRFFTAAALVSQLEKAQKQYTLDRFLNQLERVQCNRPVKCIFIRAVVGVRMGRCPQAPESTHVPRHSQTLLVSHHG